MNDIKIGDVYNDYTIISEPYSVPKIGRKVKTGIEICLDAAHKQTASLDRIDNTKGYTEDNVQWVHKIINKMKSDLTQEDFIMWCKRINNEN